MSFVEKAPTPNLPIATAHQPDEAWQRNERGTRFQSRDLPLSSMGGGSQIGVGLMILLPAGKQSCPFHYHQRDEEHFYLLSGRLVLRTGEQRVEMQAGDYVCFPAGTGVAHAFENPFDEDARVLCIGNNDPFEVCVYPDSNKVLVRALRTVFTSTGPIFDKPQRGLDYWQGEPVDEPIPGR